MITSEFVPAAYLKATGKLPSFLTGSSKWLEIVAKANQKIDEWNGEPDIKWTSLLDPAYSLGTISTTSTYELDDEINKLGDIVTVTHIDGSTTDYDVVNPIILKSSRQSCAKIGRNLVFSDTFTSTSPQYGGTITLQAYLYPEHISNDSDTIPVDNPQWLVTSVAAEINRNDVTKQNQYGNLIGEANNLMAGMVDDNADHINSIGGDWQCPGADW